MSDVSVVICAFTERRWPDLLAAVASLHAQTLPPREIVVVVDHNPRLLARARELEGVRVVASAQRPGLSGARNTGIGAASAEVIAFLDDDARAEPAWLEQLAGAYAQPGVIAAGGSVEPVWPDRRPQWFPAEFDWVVGCTHSGMPDAPSPVRNLVGANMSFRRRVLIELEGFRDGIGRVGSVPVGCEETELCIRAHRRWPDAIVLYVPQARVRHTVTAERASVRYFLERCRAEGRSKALITRLAGAEDGLSAERAYVRRTLPAGIARSLSSPGRALAIVGGLALTGAGYGAGMLRASRDGCES